VGKLGELRELREHRELIIFGYFVSKFHAKFCSPVGRGVRFIKKQTTNNQQQITNNHLTKLHISVNQAD